MAKYIVILGTIMSGLGKGVLTGSILKLLSSRGIKAKPIKFDGYLNVDCGTMNPFRHGEVFVLEDGSEVDMDFGIYERFLGENLSGKASLTGGKIFKAIIEREREGKYLGVDVQFIPHVTNYIKDYVKRYARENNLDVVIIEVGGTVGDIENSYFIEAMRQLSREEEVVFIQLTYLPIIDGQLKTKPTQHSNKLIQSMGITPKIIVGRAEKPMNKEIKEKIALFCDVKEEHIFDDPPFEYVYELPLLLEKEGFYSALAEHLRLPERGADLENWRKRLERLKKAKEDISIAIVGKYTKVRDAYVSVKEAIFHASAELGVKPSIHFIESENIEKGKLSVDKLKDYDGVIIPGGFGKRGIEGKIEAIRFARENNIPLLGLCLGMQLMIVEYARHVIGLKDAHSTEFNPSTPHPVIDLLPEQRRITKKGGTMRLGNYRMEIRENTMLRNLYGSEYAYERHRHRYEVNPDYVDMLEKHGLVIAATYKGIVEAIEYKNGLGLATQAHPELNSKFEKPSPFFIWLVMKAKERKREKEQLQTGISKLS